MSLNKEGRRLVSKRFSRLIYLFGLERNKPVNRISFLANTSEEELYRS
jgi:hypothetical protein